MFDKLDDSDLLAIDSICDRFEEAIRIDRDTPELSEWLIEVPEYLQISLLTELIEICLTGKPDQQRHDLIQVYKSQLPHYVNVIDRLFFQDSSRG